MEGTGCCGSWLPSFASLSACSFPGIPTWAGIHWRVIGTILESEERESFKVLIRGLGSEESRAWSVDIESVKMDTFPRGFSLDVRKLAAVVIAKTSAL